jgi:hypothetical protein
MTNSKKLRLAKLAGIALTLVMTSVSAHAAAWNQASNPNYFNEPYNQIHYTYNLAELPTSGVLDKEHTPWSDSYWPKDRGAFAYRWRQFQNETVNQTMTTDQRKAEFFSYHLYSKSELIEMAKTDAGRAIIDTLSPLEKFDIYIGDYNYSLTKKYLFGKGNGPSDPSWEGYCHAWAPAASHYSEPDIKSVSNADFIPITFGSSDVKALLTANYHEIMFKPLFGIDMPTKGIKSYIGGSGCPTNISFLYPTVKTQNGVVEMADYANTDGVMDSDLEANVRAYQDGLKQVLAANPTSSTLPPNAAQIANDPTLPAKARADANTCQGVNAGTFHIVMANQLGLMKVGFEFDKTRDGQIWNQPARGFTSTILGYSAPTATSAPGTVQVALVQSSIQFADDTDYSWAFWNPTLKGLFNNNQPDSGFAADYLLYSKMLINQGDETQVNAYPYNIMDSANYKYTLDLDANGNIIGGDWLTLDRPDTLWIMQKQDFKGNFKRLGEIYTPASM